MIVTLWITGADVFRITVRVTVVVFPAPSVAVVAISFSPSVSFTSLLNVPSLATSADSAVPLLSLIVTVTGPLVSSLVTPVTVQVDLFVTRLFAGELMESVGAVVSTLNATLFWVAALPS